MLIENTRLFKNNNTLTNRYPGIIYFSSLHAPDQKAQPKPFEKVPRRRNPAVWLDNKTQKNQSEEGKN